MKNTSYLHRLQSIDLLRGLILIIMVLDHVRDFYSPELFDPTDLTKTFPLLYFSFQDGLHIYARQHLFCSLA